MSEARRILLHTCCAPCATHCAQSLRPDWQVTLFFSNSNIAPRAEYDRRLAAARTLAQITACPLLEDVYDHEAWLNTIRGLEDEPERGRRCLACFAFTLNRTAAAARRNGFDTFSTTLTVSPHKRSPDIFTIGARIGNFLAVDFKKKNGFANSLALSREYGLYRQDSCGCEFSHHP